jgi:mono/diheme cytochrome c family protein
MRYPLGTIRGLGVMLGLTVGSTFMRADTSASADSVQLNALDERVGISSAVNRVSQTILLAQVPPKQAPSKKGRARSKSRSVPKGEAATSKSDDASLNTNTGELKFSRDIAPILVGNCIGCHNPERRRGNFDLTTFEKLMTGSESGPVVVPGEPAGSPLVRHIKGEDEPRMPLDNRELAPQAIAKIEAWVKSGAQLDAGIDPSALLRTIAPTGEDRRRAELGKLTPGERDKKLEAVALERWNKASSKSKPEMTSSNHFLLFSNLPKARATQTLKVLETQALALKRLLEPSSTSTVLDSPEKVSVYVFNDAATYIEFARSVESREVEPGIQAHGNLGVQAPYLVAVDPQAGREVEPAKKRSPRSKRTEEPSGPERSLAGLLVEQFAASATAQAGKPPRWLCLGLGAYFAQEAEARSPYYRRLREETARQFKLGWQAKAQEALGDATDDHKLRAIGFSLIEWQASMQAAQFTAFARMMLDGPERLDDVLKQIWDVSREEFLNEWGGWVAESYGRGR